MAGFLRKLTINVENLSQDKCAFVFSGENFESGGWKDQRTQRITDFAALELESQSLFSGLSGYVVFSNTDHSQLLTMAFTVPITTAPCFSAPWLPATSVVSPTDTAKEATTDQTRWLKNTFSANEIKRVLVIMIIQHRSGQFQEISPGLIYDFPFPGSIWPILVAFPGLWRFGRFLPCTSMTHSCYAHPHRSSTRPPPRPVVAPRCTARTCCRGCPTWPGRARGCGARPAAPGRPRNSPTNTSRCGWWYCHRREPSCLQPG